MEGQVPVPRSLQVLTLPSIMSPIDHLTVTQRRNLAVLTLFVHNLPADYKAFKMDQWMEDESGNVICRIDKISNYPCGTTGCFLGHGPEAGIAPMNNCMRWAYYGEQ